MNKSKLIAVVFLLTTFFNALGQDPTSKNIQKIRIQDFYVQTGLSLERNTNGMLSDFKTLAPQSVLLKDDMTNFSSYGGYGISGNSMFSVMVGLQFADKQKSKYLSNPLLKLGISYFSGSTLSGGTYKTTRTPYDTLTSAQTGNTIYIDSLNSQNYSMNYYSEQLRIDGSLIYRTNPEARWSLYAGIGITAGLSINAQTSIFYNNNGRKETRFEDGYTYSAYYNTSDNDKNETFKNKANFGASAYIPMGIDFRIGKKREFWKRTHLYYDLRPGLNVTSIPELQSFTSVNVQHGLGLRVSWN
jgi:hypothetical protein